MFKKISRIFLGLCLVVGTGLSAQTSGPRSYLMFGLGTQFDLASLGGTITKDGLDSARPVTGRSRESFWWCAKSNLPREYS
jgi:hypothetical protein